MIKPTIGRIVHFRNVDALDEQPQAAIIAYVHSDRLINLSVFDANGNAHPRIGVQLVHEDDLLPIEGVFAEWMEYQISQAKKYEFQDAPGPYEPFILSPALTLQAEIVTRYTPPAETVEEPAPAADPAPAPPAEPTDKPAATRRRKA